MATVSGQLQDSHINGKPRSLMSVIFDVSPHRHAVSDHVRKEQGYPDSARVAD